MSKYSSELKIKVLKKYLNNQERCENLAKKYKIRNESIIIIRVNSFKSQGYEGLKISGKNINYSFEFKKNIKLYLTEKISYQELSNQIKINIHL